MARPRNWHGANEAEDRPYLHPIVKTLYEERCKQDLTQTDLAEKIGVCLSAVQRWEKGRAMPRGQYLLDCWAQALGFVVDREPRLVKRNPLDPEHRLIENPACERVLWQIEREETTR